MLAHASQHSTPEMPTPLSSPSQQIEDAKEAAAKDQAAALSALRTEMAADADALQAQVEAARSGAAAAAEAAEAAECRERELQG
jgi:hypothetical protein